MDYGIYANTPTKTVTLHKRSCRHYKKHRKPAKTRNGKRSSFSGTRDQAISEQEGIAKDMQRAATRSKKKVEIHQCKICKP